MPELGATAVRYGEGMIARVRDAAGGPVNAVFDVAGKTPIEDLVSLAPEPSQVLTIANFAAAQAGARVTGGGAVEREILYLDHQLVLSQQLGDLRQGLHRMAVRAADA